MQGAEVSPAISETRGGETRRTVDDLVRLAIIVVMRNEVVRHRALQRARSRRVPDTRSARKPLLDEQQNDRGECAPSTPQLAVNDYRRAHCIAADHDLDELADVGEVRWTLCCNGYPCVSELEVVPNMSPLGHHVFEDHDILAVDLFPDWND